MISARVRIAAIALLWLLSAGKIFAQPYRLLTVNDFQGSPKASNYGVIAYTNCSISYSYQVRRINGIFQLTFKVPMQMNSGLSWLNRKQIADEQLAEVLKHEQGHYIIAYLQQQELLRTFARTAFGRDYAITVPNIFNRIDAKYRQLNIDYETDTNHMVNRTQQASWDKYFAKQISPLTP